MPTYEYECAGCGHNFDAFQSMSEDPLKECPSCGRPSLKRLVGGGIGIIFKGSGFYVNDSKNGKGSSMVTTEKKPDADSKNGSESSAAGASSDSKSSESTSSEAKSSEPKADSSGSSKKSA
ncbi:MAG: FmdB family zinc ribbon protein [Spirochaetota bacterium]